MCHADYQIFMYDQLEDMRVSQQSLWRENTLERVGFRGYGFEYTDQTMSPAVHGMVYKPDRKWKVALVVTPAILKYGDHEGENYDNCKIIARRRVVCQLGSA